MCGTRIHVYIHSRGGLGWLSSGVVLRAAACPWQLAVAGGGIRRASSEGLNAAFHWFKIVRHSDCWHLGFQNYANHMVFGFSVAEFHATNMVVAYYFWNSLAEIQANNMWQQRFKPSKPFLAS